MILHNTKEGEYVEDKQILNDLLSLDNTNRLEYCKSRVQIVTEDYTSWHYLKTHLSVIENLKLSEKAIQVNPKSYDSWYHRYVNMRKVCNSEKNCEKDGNFGATETESDLNKNKIGNENDGINGLNEDGNCFDEKNNTNATKELIQHKDNTKKINDEKNTSNKETSFKNVDIINRDIKLCKFLLSIDKRNLHCWNYINKLYRSCGDTMNKFTQEKVILNKSDQNRNSLNKSPNPYTSSYSFLKRDITNYTYLHYTNSFDSTSCIFTDTKNIRMWFYYFKRKEEELKIFDFYIKKYKNESEIIFREFVEEIKINGKVINIGMPTKFLCISNNKIGYKNSDLLSEESFKKGFSSKEQKSLSDGFFLKEVSLPCEDISCDDLKVNNKDILTFGENNSILKQKSFTESLSSKEIISPSKEYTKFYVKKENTNSNQTSDIIEINENKYKIKKYVNKKNEENFNLLNKLEENKNIYNFIFNLEYCKNVNEIKNSQFGSNENLENYLQNIENEIYEIYVAVKI